MNIMTYKGHKAKIGYNPDINTFRGEILGLNGGADFYGKTPDELGLEFKNSLKVFLDTCKEKGIEPYKNFSGRFNLRILRELHGEIASRASSERKSLNQWIVETIDQVVHAP